MGVKLGRSQIWGASSPLCVE